MLRLIILLAVLGALAFGIGLLADQPGDVAINWGTTHIEISLLTAALIALIVLVGFTFLWNLLRFVLRIPSIVSLASGARRRARGYAAVSRGMVALGTGDHKAALSAAREAERHLDDAPLALLLKAQTAQATGDKAAARSTFSKMAEQPETRALGLRGLHLEARRRGDVEAAHAHAREAHALGGTWAAEAVLEHHAGQEDWAAALAGVERSASARLIDKPTANRQRAVLKTALALAKQTEDPAQAASLAKEAIALAPDLIPASVLAATLASRADDPKKARRIVEAIWPKQQHPDLAEAYVNARSGDKASERLARAEALLKMTPDSPDARLAVAKAATEARNFDRAREILAPLARLDEAERPSARICLAMAALEEAQNGTGAARDWLARAARAPRDKAWIADGMLSDVWQPVSPLSGKLDAFKWEKPVERLASYVVEPAATPEIPVQPAPAPDTLSLASPAKVTATSVVFAQPYVPDDPGLNGVEPPRKPGLLSWLKN